MDLDPQCRDIKDLDNSIAVEIGSQTDVKFLRGLIEKYVRFDIVIDDASHIATHQFAGFNALFREGLKDDGVYLVEDRLQLLGVASKLPSVDDGFLLIA